MVVKIDVVKDNALSWSYTETTSPSAPGDDIAGGGALNLGLKYKKDGEFLQGEDVEVILPGTQGSLVGWVRTSSFEGSKGMEQVANLSIPTLISLLSVERDIPMMLEQPLHIIISEYISTVFPTPPEVDYRASNTDLLSFVSYQGNVWSALCSMAAMLDVEIGTDGHKIIVRDIGTRIIDVTNKTVPSLDFQENSVGRYLDITYMNQRKVETVGAEIYNLTPNPGVETNATGWSRVNSTVSGVTNSGGRTGVWKNTGGSSYYARQDMTDYKSSTLVVYTPQATITPGRSLHASAVAYTDAHRISSTYTSQYQARLQLLNNSGTVVYNSAYILVNRGSTASFSLANPIATGTRARIEFRRAWTWNG